MAKRYTVLLRIEGQCYKFFSIFLNKDPSFYIHQHLLDESSPIDVGESLALLKARGRVTPNPPMTTSEIGSQSHISIHPKGNRLYSKTRGKGGVEQHFFEEAELQRFNKKNFRLHLIQTPAPPSHLPKHDGESVKKDEELVVFDWGSPLCPQISLYELANAFDYDQIDTLLAPSLDRRLIASDGVHPAIVLDLKATKGQPGVWLPVTSIFARVISREAITKEKLQEIIKQNGLSYDILSIPDTDVITDFKIVDADSDDERLVVNHETRSYKPEQK